MKYSVKIELMKGASQDYQKLHNNMMARNFYQYQKSDNYNFEGKQNKFQLLEIIQDAVEATGHAARVQIVELKNWLCFEKAAAPIAANINL